MEVPLKIQNTATIWLSNSTTGYLPRENENTNLKIYICTPMFTVALFTIAKTWKQPTCPLMDRLKKGGINIYTYNRICTTKL